MEPWNRVTCPECEVDVTGAVCLRCGWEYDGPADDTWIHNAYESAARAADYRRATDPRRV